MKGAPTSTQFDDIYFSADDGLAETRHVFLQGNDLIAKWQGNTKENKAINMPFVIAETGFGTGLNFLCAWQEFDQSAGADQKLHFISFEQFPLHPHEIKSALEPWREILGAYTDDLIAHYPIRTGGFHRIIFKERIALTLIFGDVNDYIPQLNAAVDCWFLDGFTPAKNPTMWSPILYENMARLSKKGASFATFTAAGDVRRGLAGVGFNVQKTKGYGRKRDMSQGIFEGAQYAVATPPSAKPKIAIIGGGLAGTSCSYILKQYGLNPVLYEASDTLASGASGNEIGLFNPRFSALKGAESDYYAASFAALLRVLKTAQKQGADIDYNPCGTMHLINAPEKQKRFSKMMDNWDWHFDHMRSLSKEDASTITGIDLDNDTIYLPDAGSVSPKKLCAYYAQNIDVRLNATIENIDDLDADIIIIACASASKTLMREIDIPIHTVRGQVTWIEVTAQTQKIKTNICYGGYFSAPVNGRHALGSSFQKWLGHTDILEQDNKDNIQRVRDNVSACQNMDLPIQNARAGLRVSSHDRFPMAGRVPNTDNLYIATAFGSHGLVGSIGAAHLIADQILGQPLSLPNHAVEALSLERFARRSAKKEAKKQ